MAVRNLLIELTLFSFIDAFVISKGGNDPSFVPNEGYKSDLDREKEGNLTDVFNGVYTECFLHLSYSCVQRKTLLYLKELSKLEEVSVIGDYVKFVKMNSTEDDDVPPEEDTKGKNSEDLSFMIDRAVDKFFNNHVMKFSALGKDISIPNTGEDFVGRKKRKGGGGGGGGHGGGHDDGGKKKMMMMAMMCMKMKLMMMVPAMMGMMGMMSFKGMMFSMMSFMISKMMLLMKLLEKKGGGGAGGGGGGGDVWQASGGSGGAWMPAGGDYGGGGGYDANGQWQSRSIFEELEPINKPIISYVTPMMRVKDVIKAAEAYKPKSRSRRSIIDVIQNTYEYWMNRLLGNNIRRKTKYPAYKFVNGIKYVYYPMKVLQKVKTPKEMQSAKTPDEFKPIVIADDFSKGEIVEGPVQSRMNRKKFSKVKNDMNDAMEDNPWE